MMSGLTSPNPWAFSTSSGITPTSPSLAKSRLLVSGNWLVTVPSHLLASTRCDPFQEKEVFNLNGKILAQRRENESLLLRIEKLR